MTTDGLKSFAITFRSGDELIVKRWSENPGVLSNPPWEEDLNYSLLFAHTHKNARSSITGLTGNRYTVTGRQQLLRMKTSYCVKSDLSFDIHFTFSLKGLSWDLVITCTVVKLLKKKPTSMLFLTHNSVWGIPHCSLKHYAFLTTLKLRAPAFIPICKDICTYSICKYSGVYYDSTDLTTHLYIYPKIPIFNVYIYITEYAHKIIDCITRPFNLHTQDCTHHTTLNFAKTLFYTKLNLFLINTLKRTHKNAMKTLKIYTSNMHTQHNYTLFTNIYTNYYVRNTQSVRKNLDKTDKTIYYTHYIFRCNKDKYMGSGKKSAGTGKENPETGKKSTVTGKKSAGIISASPIDTPNDCRADGTGKIWNTYKRIRRLINKPVTHWTPERQDQKLHIAHTGKTILLNMLYIQQNYPNMHTFYMVISPQFTCIKQNTLQCQFERSKRYKSTHYLKIKLLSPPPKNNNYKMYLNFCSNKIKPAKTFRKFMETTEHNLHLAIWPVRHHTLMTGKNWTTYIRTSRPSKPVTRWTPEMQDKKLLNTHAGKMREPARKAQKPARTARKPATKVRELAKSHLLTHSLETEQL